jgi:bifunctional DNA-binding transcriptional regulator/antitoxin component of YhaV-PrlF toxin-antitoxin module
MALKPLTITITDATHLLLPLPPRVRRQAGIKAGDQLEVTAVHGVITIAAKPLAANSDEYTPEQRRAILVQVREARKGPYHGPFRNGAELGAYLGKITRARRRAGKP